jgi:ATP synthase protein I
MPKPDDSSQDAFGRLDKRLDAFTAARAPKPSPTAGIGGAGAGYRMVGELLSGVFGGIGLGWLVDHFAHTSPWGVVCGLLIGTGFSIWAVVRSASKAGAAATASREPATPAPDDDDDDA